MLIKIQEPQYITDILRLPVMSFVFNEIDFNKAIKENTRYLRNTKKTKKNQTETKKTKFTFNKPKKGEMSLTITARMMKMSGSHRIVKSSDMVHR